MNRNVLITLKPEIAARLHPLAEEFKLEPSYLVNVLLQDCFDLIDSTSDVSSSENAERFTSIATLKRFRQNGITDRFLL